MHQLISITNQQGIYTLEEVASTVLVPSGHWVHLDDWVFDLADLGPRYARTIQADMDGTLVSLSYLDIGITTYGLITQDLNPQALGNQDQILAEDEIGSWLCHQIKLWKRRLTIQQSVLATLYGREIGLQIGDQVTARHIMEWVLTYECRACWVCQNRQRVFSDGRKPDWAALGL